MILDIEICVEDNLFSFKEFNTVKILRDSAIEYIIKSVWKQSVKFFKDDEIIDTYKVREKIYNDVNLLYHPLKEKRDLENQIEIFEQNHNYFLKTFYFI